jgi:hypothetical protein
MKAELVILKDDSRQYTDAQGRQRTFRRIHAFALPRDGYNEPLLIEPLAGAEVPPLEARAIMEVRLTGHRVIGRDVVFFADQFTPNGVVEM